MSWGDCSPTASWTSGYLPCGSRGPEDFPLPTFVLEHATALIVHSRYVGDRVRAAGYEGPISVIPHPAWAVPADVASTRSTTDGLTVGCFGVVNSSKRIPELLRATAAIREAGGDVVLLLVGPTSPGFDLERRRQRLGLSDEGVVREDWVDETKLWSLMASSDVLVNLRHPTMGETSGSVIRGLSLGKPLVVSDVGWFSELPNDVALKVPIDGEEVPVLTAALELLAQRSDVREEMGANAASLAQREHDVARVAERYVAALEESVGGSAVGDRVLREVSEAAADVGIAAGTAEASEIARRLAEVELG